MRAVLAAIMVALSGVTGSARAASLLFLDSQPGDFIGQGIPQRFTEVDGTFHASRNSSNGVSIGFSGGPLGTWNADFVAPLGVELTEGTYEGAARFPFQAPTQPGLSIDGDGRGCNQLTGRFVVLEVAYGPTSDVQTFSADFEQHCEGGSPALLGSIRFQTGDPGCQQAADGTVCDAGDACTTLSRCQGGVCRAESVALCASGGQCQAAGCSPVSGICVRRALRDFSSCDDGDACTVSDLCQRGICTGSGAEFACDDHDACTLDLCHDGACDFSQPTVCADDGDPCTEEACDPLVGCTSRAIPACCHDDTECDDGNPCTEDACGANHRCVNEPAACWAITGKANATASALGQTTHVARRFVGTLTFTDDGRYRIPGGLCPQTGAPFPDEVGRTRPLSHGRLLLESTNLAKIDGALDACLGRPVRLLGSRTWVKILPDMQHLRGQGRLRARVRVRGVMVAIAISERFQGTKTENGFQLGAGALSRAALAAALASPTP